MECHYNNSVKYEIPKRGPCYWLEQMGHFTLTFHQQELCSQAFFFEILHVGYI